MEIKPDELFKNNKNFAIWVALKYHPTYGFDYDDIRQNAMIGLWQASEAWGGSSSFTTYAMHRIRGRILELYRQNTPGRKRSIHGTMEIDLVQYDSDMEDNVEGDGQIETACDMIKSIENLPEDDQKLLYDVCIKGVTFDRAGEDRGISKVGAWRRLQNIRDKIAKA